MKPFQSDFRIEEATRLLNENSSRTLAELAGACALSTSRLSHLFKAELGLTVGKFRRTCRFEEAKRMLSTPEMAIKQVAYTLGYHHASSFTRAFELYVGESPSDYRKYELEKRRRRSAITANKEQKKLSSLN